MCGKNMKVHGPSIEGLASSSHPHFFPPLSSFFSPLSAVMNGLDIGRMCLFFPGSVCVCVRVCVMKDCVRTGQALWALATVRSA